MSVIRNIEILEIGEKDREKSSPWSSTILVLKLTTDDGYVGFGEAPTTLMTLPVLEQMKEVARIFKNRDPTEIEKNVRDFYRYSFYLPVSIEATSALSAFEIASWDILGKILGAPVYKLLGGKVRENVRAYANGWYDDCIEPEEFLKKAKVVKDMGFTAIKFDPFGNQFDTVDNEHIKKAVEIVSLLKAESGMDILIEYHGRFSANSAINAARALAIYEPLFMEEPVHPDQFEGLIRLRKTVNTKVALGERVLNKNLFSVYLTNNLVDVIQPDLTNVGGIMEAKKAAILADTFGVEVAFHNAFGPVQTAATLNLDLNITNFLIQESFEKFWPDWKRNLIKTGYTLENGYFKLSDNKGLGIEINERILDEYKVEGMEPFDFSEPPWVVKGTYR